MYLNSRPGAASGILGISKTTTEDSGIQVESPQAQNRATQTPPYFVCNVMAPATLVSGLSLGHAVDASSGIHHTADRNGDKRKSTGKKREVKEQEIESTTMHTSAPSRPHLGNGCKGRSDTVLQTPNLMMGKARRVSSQLDTKDLEVEPYKEDRGISLAGQVQHQGTPSTRGKGFHPGLLRRAPTTHSLSHVPKSCGISAPVLSTSPSDSGYLLSDERDCDGGMPDLPRPRRGRISLVALLPVFHAQVEKFLDAVGPWPRLFNLVGLMVGMPWIQAPPPPCPRLLPENLVRTEHKSFHAVPNSAGINVPHAPVVGSARTRKGAQVPAVRIYSKDWALALKGEYGYDHRLTALHFRLRHAGVPYADCPAIWFLAPNWSVPYIWSTYPYHVERYPYWFLWRPDSFDSRYRENSLQEGGRVNAEGERNYCFWDYFHAHSKSWAAGGLDASLKEMICERLVPDFNHRLKSEDRAKDRTAAEIIKKLNWLVVSVVISFS